MLQNNLLVAYNDYWKETFEDGSKLKHYDYPDVWTSFAKDNLASVFLFAAIALAVILLAVGLFVYFKKREALKNFLTVAISLAVGFAVAVIVSMLALEFMDMAESGDVFDLVLWPAVALGACVVLGVAAVYVCSLFGKKAFKIGSAAALSAAGAALVALLVCLGVYLARGAGEENGVTSLDNVLLYVSAIVLIGVILFIAFFFGRKDRKGFDSKSISYAAICIAMSFALSYLKPVDLPQGGSVTVASLLPLMIYAYMFGTKKGVFAGFIYGILQAVQDPWLIHPAQFLLDYPIAFSCIGAAGIFAHVKSLEKLPQVQFALGAIVASVFRFVCHVLSGVFAFTDLAGDPVGAWAYSLGYNSFVFADIAIVIAVGILVFSSKAFVKQARRFNTPAEKTAEETTEE